MNVMSILMVVVSDAARMAYQEGEDKKDDLLTIEPHELRPYIPWVRARSRIGLRSSSTPAGYAVGALG